MHGKWADCFFKATLKKDGRSTMLRPDLSILQKSGISHTDIWMFLRACLKIQRPKANPVGLQPSHPYFKQNLNYSRNPGSISMVLFSFNAVIQSA